MALDHMSWVFLHQLTFKQSLTDMSTGQHDLGDSSLRLSYQMVLDSVGSQNWAAYLPFDDIGYSVSIAFPLCSKQGTHEVFLFLFFLFLWIFSMPLPSFESTVNKTSHMILLQYNEALSRPFKFCSHWSMLCLFLYPVPILNHPKFWLWTHMTLSLLAYLRCWLHAFGLHISDPKIIFSWPFFLRTINTNNKLAHIHFLSYNDLESLISSFHICSRPPPQLNVKPALGHFL